MQKMDYISEMTSDSINEILIKLANSKWQIQVKNEEISSQKYS